MNKLKKEFKKESKVQQLKSLLGTHKDNFDDLKNSLKLYTSNKGVFSVYLTTLESDITLLKHCINELEQENNE